MDSVIAFSLIIYNLEYLCPKSLYRSRTGRHFYGTEIGFWAGFGQYWKKKFRPIMSNFWARFFHVFGCKKIFDFFFLPPKTWKNRPQIGLNSQSILYCSIGDTSLRDFYIMTLLMPMSLPYNFNHQVYQSDLLVLFTAREKYTTKKVRSKLIGKNL